MKLLKRFKKNENGQTLVEFALILPIMIVLLLGTIQFGFILNGQITVTSAAREGARLAVVNVDDDLVKDRVGNAAVALLLNVDKNNGIVINRDLADGMLSVNVEGTVKIIVPLIGTFTGNSFTLSAESIMRIEQEI
jgi:Flp pilus assembly pilin Flp